MFSFARLRRFLGNLLGISVPFLLGAFVFAVLTQLVIHRGALPEAVMSFSFWLLVALAMIPVIAAMALALWLAARFVAAVYGLEGAGQGLGFILNSRLDLRAFGPWAKVEKGHLAEKADSILSKVGGPGHLVIYNDSAVLMEKAGRLTRVEGVWETKRPRRAGCSEEEKPGFPRLDAFERIYAVVDLRPKRSVRRVSGLTRDGIRVHWGVEIQYQIEGSQTPPTEAIPYPISEAPILCAATGKWVCRDGANGVLDWEVRLDMEADRLLRTIVAGRRMDQLIGRTPGESGTAREEVQALLEKELRVVAPELGARILRVKLDNLEVDDAVGQQWIGAWSARWQRWSMDWLAQADASRIYEYETAKAEAQMQMILQLTRAIQSQIANRAIPAQAMPQIVLMRLFSVLDRADFAPSSRVFFPTETIRALEGIQHTLGLGGQEPAAVVLLTVPASSVPAGGSIDLEVSVSDARGDPVPDGTLVHLDATLGNVAPGSAFATRGRAQATFTAGSQLGEAIITARTGSGSHSVTITVV